VEPFGHDVRVLKGRRNVKDMDVPQGNLLAHEVDVDLDMLCELVVDRVTVM
jgi:hypothetical protein